MTQLIQQNQACCSDPKTDGSCGNEHGLQAFRGDCLQEEVCCGSPPGPRSSLFEKPGYKLMAYVDGFEETPIGPVPRIKTHLERWDIIGTIAVRLGVQRDNYKVSPGLYCVGSPTQTSPVLVTANYKLSFDHLRKQLTSVDAWILVLDTRGINVWCAAGKSLFSTAEVVRLVKLTFLNKVVSHHELILPQLGATGVSAHQVKKESGFKVIWGPVRAEDIKAFLNNGKRADPAMRRVTFSTIERFVLVPVELSHLPKPSLWGLLAIFLFSGIGMSFFSLHTAWFRGLMALTAYAAGIMAGAVIAPVLLPWIPGRSFALKGAITGLFAGIATVAAYRPRLVFAEALALVLCAIAVSSYLAMNFTGSTPYTSPSGVEKEMRRAIPLQVAALLVAVIAWVGAAFAG